MPAYTASLDRQSENIHHHCAKRSPKAPWCFCLFLLLKKAILYTPNLFDGRLKHAISEHTLVSLTRSTCLLFSSISCSGFRHSRGLRGICCLVRRRWRNYFWGKWRCLRSRGGPLQEGQQRQQRQAHLSVKSQRKREKRKAHKASAHMLATMAPPQTSHCFLDGFSSLFTLPPPMKGRSGHDAMEALGFQS